MKNQKLTQERLKELLHYDPETGLFTWLISTRCIKVGDTAGTINDRGYMRIKIGGRQYKASRLAWLYQEGYFPEHCVDHINRIRHDDRWCNLRHVSIQCNNRNCGIQQNNTSGITGVRWYKKSLQWRAEIYVSGKNLHLGCFTTKGEAAKARWEAEKKYNFTNCNSTSPAYLYLKERGLA